MSLNRWAKERDGNEKQIIEIFERMGLSVDRLDQPADLLVGYNNRNYLVEVKTKIGKLTKKQKKFISTWNGQHIVIDSTSQAEMFAKSVREEPDIIKSLRKNIDLLKTRLKELNVKRRQG